MRLAINATDVGRQRGGNESYLLGLLDGLRALPDSDDRFTLLTSRAGAPELAARYPAGRFTVIDLGPWQRWPSYLWRQTLAIRHARAGWYLSTFLLPPIVPCRAALLIHDLSFRAHPEYFPATIAAYMRALVGLAARRADVVVALSEFTRRELGRFYPFALRRSVVVYPGVDPAFNAGGDPAPDRVILRAHAVEPPFILAVGNIHPRKNLGRLLDAYLRLRESRRDLPAMVWAGIERWGSADLQARAQAAGVKLTGRISPEHLPAFYRQAQALVYPSVYEGFGLPPLEAMACGTPVVAGNTTGLPEAVGDAALTTDPTDVSALSTAIERAVYDTALRAELRARGLARAQVFRWERTARSLLEALGAHRT